MIESIKETLQNFPSEVIEEWLLPYAKSEGWPPQVGFDGIPLVRWRYLLGRRSLDFFKTLHWKKEYKHISIQEISERSLPALIQIFETAILGHQNAMSSNIPDLKERFLSIVGYIQSHGTMPKAPALYCEGIRYYVFDGNHRLSAYYYCYGYFKVHVESELMLNTQKENYYWIAYQ